MSLNLKTFWTLPGRMLYVVVNIKIRFCLYATKIYK